MPVHRHKTEEDDMVWPPDDFTGEWIVEWPNGQVKFRSLFLKGKTDGDYLCYWWNGNLAQKGFCKDGEPIGIWWDYQENGVRFKETEFYSQGNFDTRWLTPEGLVRQIDYHRDGQETRTETMRPKNA